MNQNQGFSLSRILLTAATFLLIGLATPSVQAQPDGKALYDNNCAACHRMDQDLVGPALGGVTERLEEDYLIRWIRNSQEVIASGDEYAVAQFSKWNKIAMPAYDWTDEEIKSVLAYIESQSAPATATTDDGGGTAVGTAELEEGFPLSQVIWVLIFLAAAVIYFLAQQRNKLQAAYDDKVAKGELDPAQIKALKPAFKIKPIHAIGGGLTFFLIAAIGWGIDVSNHVGIQQGYQPSQPIAFSHELHAGTHEIACSYCHTGVERGKSATIPAVNVCMNCHNQIKKDAPEIKKIHAAWENNKPIEWIRIHNLPDFAYFNHYQHYKLAGIECQTCHGEIQEMPEVYQHSTLTMGWCINCHRETKVDLDNGYYQAVHGNTEKFQQALLENGLTIANLGGLECSKCHY
ncbi:MAG: c-type cytochrome [Bacteroidia bacterium]